VLPDGTIKTLWTDALPLADLGPLAIERASSIEFWPIRQKWAVQIEGSIVFESTSRAECLAWEHDHFNNQLLNS
jgi:hypothetical protein